MLELEIVPERSIGCEQWEFILGMHFSQAVAIIQSQVGVITGVQVIYSDSNPLGTDLVLNLPQDGIRLVFDSVVQRLKIIEIFNMKLVKLKYCGLVFNSPEVCPSIEQIEHSFGATHPGVYDAEKHLFTLNFRGLSFSFHVDTKFQQASHGQGLGSLQFASGCSPCVTSTSVYCGHSLADCSTPPLPLSCFYAQLYLNYVDVLRDADHTKGLRLHLYTEGTSRSRKQSLVREVLFSDTCQDVATLLGSPQRIFFKAEDKMKIHSPNAHRRVTARRSDFFFNYFSLGIDILFDARTQKVKKFVLHTNYPGHYNFNTYQRCEFHLGFPSPASDKPVQISAYTKWDSVCEQVKPSERPVVLNRASSTNTTNPFGSTFCYGFQDIIFEVMSNQHIASVTLYWAQDGRV